MKRIVLIICLVIAGTIAGTIAVSTCIQNQNKKFNSARVENKVKPDSLKKSLPCNRYYNEVLMY